MLAVSLRVSNRIPLAITSSDAPMSATTAIHNVAEPATASARKTAFSASESVTFTRMLRSVARPSRIANGIFEQLVGHQRDVGGLERRVGAGGAHRNAHVGRRKRGRIVDAVAHHRHRSVFLLQLLNDRHFVVRQQLGVRLVDADARAPAPRRLAWLSPVSITTRCTPWRRSMSMASAADSRVRSASAMMPSGRPSRATSTAVRPDAASASSFE